MPENKQNDIDVSDFEDEQPLTDTDVPELSDKQKEQWKNRYGDYSLWQRLKRTWKGKNDFGRIAGTVLDIGETFLPQYVRKIRDGLQSQTTNKPMKDKIRKLSKFFSFKDDDGNWSLKEAGYSILKVAILSGIAWGAVQLGIWNQLIELFEIIG